MSVVSFCWAYPGHKVSVSGSWATPWPLLQMHRNAAKLFRANVTLNPGIYQYRFVLEDEQGRKHWCYDSTKPTTVDQDGNWNNVIVVENERPRKQFYLTTAINYTNGPPHFGHAYEAIVGDTISRYHRVSGKDVFFMTGTDEHGQKVAETATQQGLKPIELCDKHVASFKDLNNHLKVEEDFYIRTTMKKHEDTCKWLWERANAAGDIYLGNYEGWYNVREEKFVTEGEAEKLDFKDPGSGKPLIKTSEPSYFFKMSKYQQKLLQHIYDNPGFIFPEEKEAEILTRLSEPLLDLSISRTSFDWGVPCPTKDEKKHVMYVWYDALTNYLSGIDYPNGKNAHYWPADVHLIGKDISWFHSVIWPCMLLSAGIPLPRHIVCHGFVNGPDGRKMSKSIGNVVDPVETLKKFSADNIRYFCLREGVFGEDFSFSEPSLILRHDSELADDLGNLVHRSFTLAQKWNDSKVPKQPYKELFSVSELKETVATLFDNFHIQQAFEEALNVVKITNKYLADIAPWNLKGEEHTETKLSCVRTALEAVYILSHFYYPIIPTAAETIFRNLNKPMTTLDKLKGWGNLTPGSPLTIPQEVLFQKIQQNRFERKHPHAEKTELIARKVEQPIQNTEEPPKSQEQPQKGGKKQQQPQQSKKGGGGAQKKDERPVDISRVNLRIGKIISCKNHPSADHLYIEEIDLGESKPRQVVSGLANHIPLDKMQNRMVVVVSNMKPGNFRQVLSQAMVIAATSPDGVVDLLNPPEGAKIGEKVSIDGYNTEPDAVLDAKKLDVIALVKPDMTTNADGVACYKGVPWMTSAGPCVSGLVNSHLG